jgi:hypothetical protein
MSAKIIKFPKLKKLTQGNAETKKDSSIKQPKNNVKRIDEIKREEERSNEMFPPNYFMLIA